MESFSWKLQNEDYLKKTIKRCQEKKIILPKFSELRNPDSITQKIKDQLPKVGMQDINPLNLFRIGATIPRPATSAKLIIWKSHLKLPALKLALLD